jgi:hypothetical protein
MTCRYAVLLLVLALSCAAAGCSRTQSGKERPPQDVISRD